MSGLLASMPSARKLLIREVRSVVVAAREARSALSAVVKLSERKQRETLQIDDDGVPVQSWARLTPRERLESFHQALVWLQQAENKVRETRIALERAIERAERMEL